MLSPLNLVRAQKFLLKFVRVRVIYYIRYIMIIETRGHERTPCGVTMNKRFRVIVGFSIQIHEESFISECYLKVETAFP